MITCIADNLLVMKRSRNSSTAILLLAFEITDFSLCWCCGRFSAKFSTGQYFQQLWPARATTTFLPNLLNLIRQADFQFFNYYNVTRDSRGNKKESQKLSTLRSNRFNNKRVAATV